MEFTNNINYVSLADTAISLTAAFFFGGLIGLERQYRQRTAGLRTNILVAIGAAIFVDAANRLTGHEGAVLRRDVGELYRVFNAAFHRLQIGFADAEDVMLNNRLRGEIDTALAAVLCSTMAAFCWVAWSICVTAEPTWLTPALCSALAALISSISVVTRRLP